jgi:hypothetical protein
VAKATGSKIQQYRTQRGNSGQNGPAMNHLMAGKVEKFAALATKIVEIDEESVENVVHSLAH